MPSSCWAPNCTNRLCAGSGIKMHRFPSDKAKLDGWLVSIGRMCGKNQTTTRRDGLLEPKDHDRLCSAHFVSGRPSADPTNVDYKPTLFAHTPRHKREPKRLKRIQERQDRVKEREAKRSRIDVARALVDLSLSIHEEIETETGISTQTDVHTNTAGTQTDMCVTTLEEDISRLQKQIEQLEDRVSNMTNELLLSEKVELSYRQQLYALEQKLDELQNKIKQMENNHHNILQSIFHFDHNLIKDDDNKTSYYTGLPTYKVFTTIFEECSKIVTRSKTKLLLIEEFFICLVKLRHNIGVDDIAFRYKISAATATRVFHAWLDALFSTLSGLVMWPETDYVQLPECFRTEEFKNVKCIIDCTEIFIERPSSLKARAQTYSHYKKHNTVKFLIGITPSGSISFLSKAWTGRASDKKITLEERFISKLNPGDAVMADRGFIMQEDFAMHQVKLIVPSFTKGKKQLTAVETETSRRIARARIHVERVIGRTKTFQILREVLPISLIKRSENDIPTIEKIVTVIVAIINLCPPIL